SPMPLEVLEKAYEVLDCDFSANYGMTEASPVLSNLSIEDHSEGFHSNVEKIKKRITSVGRQVVGVDVNIVDEKGDLVNTGEIGEIVAKGPNIMKGYWRKKEETDK